MTTNTTSIIVTHEVSFALKVADRIVLMDRGKIVETGAPQISSLLPSLKSAENTSG